MTRRAGTNNQMFLVRTFSYFRYKKTGDDVSGFYYSTLSIMQRLRTAVPGCGSFWSRKPDKPDRYHPRSDPEPWSSLPG